MKAYIESLIDMVELLKLILETSQDITVLENCV